MSNRPLYVDTIKRLQTEVSRLRVDRERLESALVIANRERDALRSALIEVCDRRVRNFRDELQVLAIRCAANDLKEPFSAASVVRRNTEYQASFYMATSPGDKPEHPKTD